MLLDYGGEDPVPPASTTKLLTARAALTGGFHSALWMCGAIALLAIPVTFLLIRKDEIAAAVTATMASEPQPQPAA